MKKVLSMAAVAIALGVGATMTVPSEGAAAEAGSVCQFYRGEPVCKTVQESACFGGSVGVEGRICRTTTEYWYWS